MTRYTLTGLEEGRKRILIWEDGELTGDEDLKARFYAAWDAVHHGEYRKSLSFIWQPMWPNLLARQILRTFFAETLDFATGQFSSPRELERQAVVWNERKGAGHCTVEDLRRDEEELNWRDHHGPPYSWGEIEAQLGRGEPDGVEEQPEQRPKCLECLQPMEWMYYKDEPESWISSGWTAICRGCHTWRACRIPGFPGLTGWESVAAEALATGTHGMG